MEFKALILGLVFSLGIFAVKNGVGLHYLLQASLRCTRDKAIVLTSYATVYAGIFLLAWWGLQRLTLLNHFQALQHVLRSGMLMHVLLSGMLIIWGLLLLIRDKGGKTAAWGWAPLVLPCPVCALVIFLNVSLLLSLYPDAGLAVLAGAWAGFVGLGIGIAIVFRLLTRQGSERPETMLGGAMLTIAAFFLLTVVLMPQFGQLDEIYRLASYESEKPPVTPEQVLALTGSIVGLFGAGFWVGNKKH
jgi:predicted transporter